MIWCRYLYWWSDVDIHIDNDIYIYIDNDIDMYTEVWESMLKTGECDLFVHSLLSHIVNGCSVFDFY